MKLLSFSKDSRSSYGMLRDEKVVDLGRALGDRLPTLRSVLAADALGEVESFAREAAADYSIGEVTLLPPIPDPDKIICIGKNYKGHVAEANVELPQNPSLFTRLTNTLVAHEQDLILAKVSSDFDFEGELAVVIGKGGRHIPLESALEHVAGYSIFNDACFRDIQFKHSLTAGKNFVSTGGFGPWLVTADEIPDPEALMLSTRLNGVEVQHTRTDDLIFRIPQLIAYISSFTPLVAGDVIATGTPDGVGFARKPPLWMKDGDVVEVEISGIGTLRNTVAREV